MKSRFSAIATLQIISIPAGVPAEVSVLGRKQRKHCRADVKGIDPVSYRRDGLPVCPVVPAGIDLAPQNRSHAAIAVRTNHRDHACSVRYRTTENRPSVWRRRKFQTFSRPASGTPGPTN